MTTAGLHGADCTISRCAAVAQPGRAPASYGAWRIGRQRKPGVAGSIPAGGSRLYKTEGFAFEARMENNRK